MCRRLVLCLHTEIGRLHTEDTEGFLQPYNAPSFSLTLQFLNFLTQTGFKAKSHCLPSVSESSVSHGGKEESNGKYT